eukprot:scaffold117928_cov32-Prasinocladus_malaysianus.AAC.2
MTGRQRAASVAWSTLTCHVTPRTQRHRHALYVTDRGLRVSTVSNNYVRFGLRSRERAPSVFLSFAPTIASSGSSRQGPHAL